MYHFSGREIMKISGNLFLLVFATLVIAVGLCLAVKSSAQAKGDNKLRIGTYDSRAIAIAYAPSKYNNMDDFIARHKEAKKNGDAELIKELEKEAERHQKRMLRQGFGKYPVDDLLAHIKNDLPAVAKEAGVDVIASGMVYASPNVEVVDITDILVKPFQPSEKTWGHIREIKKHKPVEMN
jgi:hypothetical protein